MSRDCIAVLTGNPLTLRITEIRLQNHKLVGDVQRTLTRLANPGVDADPEIVRYSLLYAAVSSEGAQGHELN